MDVLHKSVGCLNYSDSDGYRCTVEVDQQISEYYRSLIPKYLPVIPPRWPAHITVVRAEKETPVHLEHWAKYDGESVEFYYSPHIRTGKVYYWLNTFCGKLEELRLELGLPIRSEYTMPPEGDGFRKCFHMTIGNQKVQ